jgi:hypothetical protein
MLLLDLEANHCFFVYVLQNVIAAAADAVKVEA